MKICMLTSGHDVFDNRIYYKEILSLKKRYDQIYLVAPGDKDFVTEHGIIVKCFPKRKKWYDRMRPMKDIFNIAKEINADVYHAHEPDSFQVATKLKKELNAKIIYDSHEYYPEAFAEHFGFISSLVKNIIYLYEKRLAKQADCIITVNNILVDKFKKYHDNVQLIPNYPVIKYRNFENKLNKKPTFIYVGGLREDRGIFKILQAINIIKDRDFKYIFLGSFETEKFELKCRKFINNKLNNMDITFTGKIPHKRVFDYLNISHVGFVILQPDNWRYVNSEPVKLFEYMSSKIAVIGSNFPMVENIISSCENGILVKPDSPQDISRAILKLAENLEMVKVMGNNGFNKVKEIYNWNICEKRLLDAYEKLGEKLK
ncbi:glycosyltransferase involved in cell wall biosynthesis [Clostridium algifaecis]|uniref:Glycosyltransferase involved in cell wall biosynthesis n=1 Tax=Clostridium algifaecis TaxID=1472040 RepID=A0ABS4KR04_9CLOT|nr:glycosyltransferase family 4 protein [Clostridium algifaecis]MBP2032467.1 glycosyltransferase involved in cell wall biosynthesis [Clostridium algifaecis]